MKAAVLREYGEPLQISEVQLAEPGPGEVRVKVKAAGVCHSDLSVLGGNLPIPLPAIPGHEGSGVVDAVGEGVTRVQVGDHVVFNWVASCGHCYYCDSGRPDMCDTAFDLQVTGTLPDGTTRFSCDSEEVYYFSATSCMAEMTVVPESGVIPIRRDVPFDRAALVGCAVMTGYGAVVKTAQVKPGSSVVVIGCGGVGLNVIQAAKLVGAETIIAIDRVGAKLAKAQQFGATHVIDASQTDDPFTPVLEWTEGRGADYAFEVIGRPETIAQAYGLVRKAGMAVVVGVAPPHEEVSINAFSLPSQTKILTGTWYGQAVPEVDIPLILDLYMEGKLDLDALITGSYSLDQINDAFAALRSGQAVRSIIRFD